MKSKVIKLCGAYTITHIKSGKVYVGSTNDLGSRRLHHLSALKLGTHRNKELQKAFEEDSTLEFFHVITEDREAAYLMEEELMRLNKNKLFNRAIDVKAPMSGLTHSEQTRLKIGAANSLALKGRKLSLEHAEKVSRTLLASNLSRQKRVQIVGVVYNSLNEAARALNLNPGTLYHRLKSTNSAFLDWIEL